MKTGTRVKVKEFPVTDKNTWASIYMGKTGTIEGKCRLYKGLYSVRIDHSLASFKKNELEVCTQ